MSDSNNDASDAEQTVIRKLDKKGDPSESTLADRVMGRVRGGKDDGSKGSSNKDKPGSTQGAGAPQGGGQKPQNPGAQESGAQKKDAQKQGAQANAGGQANPSGPGGKPSDATKPGDATKQGPQQSGGQGGKAAAAGAAGAAAAGGSGRQQTHSGQQAQAGQQGQAGQVRTGEAAQGVPAPSKGGQQTQQPAKEAAAQQNASQGGKPQEGRGAAAKAGLAAAAGVATGRAAADGSKDDADKARQVGRTRRTRKARLRLSQIDPWSVMKTSFLFSIAGAVILIVATLVVYGVLEASGLFNHINTIVAPFLETPGDTEEFDIKRYIGFQRVLGGSVVLAAINIAIITALATLGAFLYNLASSLIGGLEVTLAED